MAPLHLFYQEIKKNSLITYFNITKNEWLCIVLNDNDNKLSKIAC